MKTYYKDKLDCFLESRNVHYPSEVKGILRLFADWLDLGLAIDNQDSSPEDGECLHDAGLCSCYIMSEEKAKFFGITPPKIEKLDLSDFDSWADKFYIGIFRNKINELIEAVNNHECK